MALNWHLQLTYDFNDKIGIGLNLNAYFNAVSSPNFERWYFGSATLNPLYITPDSSWQELHYKYNLEIRRFSSHVTFVPEYYI